MCPKAWEVHNQLPVFIQKISNVGVQTLPEFQKHLLIYDASSLMDRLRYIMSCHGVAKSGVPALRVSDPADVTSDWTPGNFSGNRWRFNYVPVQQVGNTQE